MARLAGTLRGHGLVCTQVDANWEGLCYLLGQPVNSTDTWSQRAWRNLAGNLAALRSPALYTHPARYRRAAADVNRVVYKVGQAHNLKLSLANCESDALSPIKSADLLQAAAQPEANVFYPYFSLRLPQFLAQGQPTLIGFSLNYLSQAACTFAMIGLIKKHYPGLPIVLGGGLVTSWLRNPSWQNPFAGLVDHLVAGPGEGPLLSLLGRKNGLDHYPPDYQGLPLGDYLAPGTILPYAASSGCYWNKCSFCPERAEGNPYTPVPSDIVLDDLRLLTAFHHPVLLHLLDNAVSPSLLKALIANPPGVPWYGFARISPALAEDDFCRALRQSGCVMLKLGLESGSQEVLDATAKGIDLDVASRCLSALKKAGIATYVYLLFGTPFETIVEARTTLDYVVRHGDAINFLNLAIFNMPRCGPETHLVETRQFFEADLCLYTDFVHSRGWGRAEVRRFLDQEFKRHPAIKPILRRDPPLFTSNHAPFFV